ncbi:type II toxin-antitoxin system RelE/ParE family toxin [Flavobacterium soli]|uniref:type II toxin-antitoxin system RelE/ParE family toxin n=1 Tax=Flavobacterium soli TaxID=344881 RepID=UPI00047CDE6D|nr:type II toxin-antitoxin system RelE/ParE family toxin [Flavobacterium soli]
MEKEIVWTETALEQLQDIYFYILEESKSFSIADKVIDRIMDSVTILKSRWEIYEIDEMRLPNSHDYRAFEIYSYRISYKVTDTSIFIIRIRHTSRNPKSFF